jgi:Fe(3+) dicitrate transport protein
MALAPTVALAQTVAANAPPASPDSAPGTPPTPPAPAPARPSAPDDAVAPAEPPASSTAKEPVEVRIIGSRADSLQKVPGSGQIVSAKEIQDAQPYDAAEMLNRIPGVTARQEQESGARLDIGVRGLDPGRSRNLLVLEDGIPMSLNPYAEPDLYIAPQIERMRGIEVLKGSGSILYGPSTIGGVINFLTLAPPPRPTALVEADYGSFNYKKGLVQYGDTFGPVRYILQGTYKAGDGFEALPFQTTDIFTKVAVDTSKTGQAIVKLGYHDDATYADDIGLTRAMFAQDPGQASLAPNDRMHQRRYSASLIYEDRLGSSTTLQTLVYAYETQRHWRRQEWARTPYDPNNPAPGTPSGFTSFAGDFSVPGSGVYFLNADTILDRVYDVAGVEPRFVTQVQTGSVSHKLEYGARLLGETAEYQQSTGALYNSDSGALQEMETHRTVAEAAYLQDTMAFRDNLLFTPGVRIEHADFHRIVLRQAEPASATNVCTAGQSSCPTDVNLPGNISSTGFIPGVGMIYGSRDNHVFGGVHYGWQPPRVASSFSPMGTPYPVSAQTATNWEVGTRLAPVKWLRGEVSGFVIAYENEIIAGSSNSGDGSGLTNGGPTRHVGAEAAASIAFGRALQWKTAVDLVGRYSAARATFVGGQYNGNIVPYAPLNTFSVLLDINHPSGIGGEVAFYFTDSQFADPADTRAEDATGQYGLIPAHNDLDGNIHYTNAPTGLSVRLSVKDALEDYYITERRPNGIAVGGFRQVTAGLRWEWEKKEKKGVAE